MNRILRRLRATIVQPGPAGRSQLDVADRPLPARHVRRPGVPRTSRLTPAEHRAEVARLEMLAAPLTARECRADDLPFDREAAELAAAAERIANGEAA